MAGAERRVALPSRSVAQYTVAIELFGFFAVALLQGSLAESLRSAGARLEHASTEIADLRAFNQYVIDSLLSGLVTADPDSRILTFNRAARRLPGVRVPIGRRPRHQRGAAAAGGSAVDAAHDLARRRSDAPIHVTGTPDGRVIEIGLTRDALETPDGRAGFSSRSRT